jgi:hypothetical protein
MVRPIFILSDTLVNSSEIGPGISVPTMPIVSEIGRPERRPRTISSIASGKRWVNLFTRRVIRKPIVK